MKKIILIITALFSVTTFASSITPNRNCDLALNMDLSNINICKLESILYTKGYTFRLEEVSHDDFPLEEEFMLSVYVTDSFPKVVTVTLSQKEIAPKPGSKIIFTKEKKSFSAERAIMNTIDKLPSCI